MTKTQPLGTCDQCLGPIEADRWHTSKGQPRMYCSRQCRNTGNSRAGSDIRSAKARRRVERGEWQNPARLNPPTPEEQSRRARLARKREVEAGTWRNPALDEAARRKLSRPRKHAKNPTLHRAMEKLRGGGQIDMLTPDEQREYRRYRARLRDARRSEINTSARRRYHRRRAAMSEEEKEAQRAMWRKQNRRRR